MCPKHECADVQILLLAIVLGTSDYATTFEFTIVTRDVCVISPIVGPGAPERVRERYCYSVFNYSYHLSVGSLTGGTVDRCPGQPLHAVRPVGSADIYI